MMAPVEGSVNGAVVHFDVDYTPDEGEEDDRLIPDVDTATGRGACERLDESQAPKDRYKIMESTRFSFRAIPCLLLR